MRAATPIVTRRTLLERAREQMKQRAAALASRGGTQAGAVSAGHMLLCAVGPDVFAIPVHRIAETLPLRQIAPLPGASNEVMGLMWSGGNAVVVLHLGRLLGILPAAGEIPDAHILVLRRQGRRVALLVDRVLAATDVTLAAPDEVASLANPQSLQHVHIPSGLAAAPLAAVLDVDRLIPNAAAAAALPGA